METRRLETLKQIAAGVAAQFGSNCEVVIHDVSGNRPDHTIVHIENGHVSGRKVGDGASQVVLDQLARQDEQPKDHLCYLTRTPDGKILKSSSLYIRNSRGGVVAIFSINYDVSGLMMIQNTIGAHHQRQRRPRRAHRPVGGHGGKACGTDEQGGQGSGHPVSEPVGGLSGDQVRRQSGKILRYFQIYPIFLHRRKQRRRQMKQEEKT